MTNVTALVCTRNRPRQIANAVRSLLDGSDDMELIVIDQSPGAESEQALAPWKSDARFTYHRSKTTGKGAGLNEGLGMAKGVVVVLTDDDCEVPRGWVSEMARILLAKPKVGILFCNVVPVPYDRATGYVPAYERERSRLLESVDALRDGLGLGAGMAILRDVAQTLGGFDELFGPGARFPSADEWDLSIRALLAGWQIFETPELAIVHDGFRSFAQGREHARRDWIALGAVCAKALRAGRLRGVGVSGPMLFFPKTALWPPIADLLHFKRPQGLGRIAAFCRGFADGMRTPMDPETLRFLTQTAAPRP